MAIKICNASRGTTIQWGHDHQGGQVIRMVPAPSIYRETTEVEIHL